MIPAFVSLGSNVGDRAGHLERAVTGLARVPRSRLQAVSSWYDAEPVGDPRLARYLNGVVRIDTDLTAQALWAEVRRVEGEGGRPPTGRAGPRTIDLDLLYYGDRVVRHPGLWIPHPGVADRLFVLVPMMEVAPAWVDPALGVPLARLLSSRRNLSSVRWVARAQW
jgi:2-amino-4-hydroxy-6-hydroxymethyldihydropteridine diphosphokinase